MNTNPQRRPIAKPIVNQALELARLTSAENAARAYGMCVSSVRNWLRAAGIKPRRVGNYTLAEAERMGRLLQLPRD